MKKNKSIIFLGSKDIGFDCLSYLIQKASALNLEIKGVLTKVNALSSSAKNIPALCAENQIPVLENLEALWKEEAVDFLYSVQYHKILKQKHIDKARVVAVNLHMAPLPDYRGCNQFSFAIIDEAEEFGTTIHQMSTKIDGGAILFEDRFSISKEIWVKELHAKTVNASLELFKTSLAHLVQGNYSPVEQASYYNSRSSSFHFRKDIEAAKCLSLDWSKRRLERHIRACYFPPFEPPYFNLGGKRVYVQVEDSKEK